MHFSKIAPFAVIITTLVVNILCIQDGDWWELDGEEFRNGSKIQIRQLNDDDNLIHSCYEYRFVSTLNNTVRNNSFCYPAIIVTGVAKCSTSALYGLLTALPFAVVLPSKESCLSAFASIVDYFDYLPRRILPGSILVDGCIQLESNLKIRKWLNEPSTFYVLLVRDYSDWIWSAYNYWCSQEHDGRLCRPTRWAMIGKHSRSASQFHDIIFGSMNGSQLSSPLKFDKPCEHASTFYRTRVSSLLAAVSPNAMIVLNSEMLEKDPSRVWASVAKKAGLPWIHPTISEFSRYRYNTQQTHARIRNGYHPELSVVEANVHEPGLYAISNHEPLWNSTRAILNKCWLPDCAWISNFTGYQYTACQSIDKGTVDKPVSTSTTYIEGDDGFLNSNVRMCKQIIMRSKEAVSFANETRGPILIVTDDPSDERELIFSLTILLKDNQLRISRLADFNSSTLNHFELQKTSSIVFGSLDAIYNISSATESHRLTTRGHQFGYRVIIPSSPNSQRFRVVNVNRVIFHVRDLTRSSISSASGGAGAGAGAHRDEESAHLVDWRAYESDALRLLRSDSKLAKLAQLADRLPRNDLLIVPANAMTLDSKSFRNHLLRIFNFSGFDCPWATDELFRCSFASLLSERRSSSDVRLATAKKKDSLFETRLFASREFRCKVEKAVSGMVKNSNVLAVSGFAAVGSGHHCRNMSVAEEIMQTEKLCRLRYDGNEGLAAHTQLPAALVAESAEETVIFRRIVEVVTGVWTGSLVTNISNAALFGGEKICSRKTPLIYANPQGLNMQASSSKLQASVHMVNPWRKRCASNNVDKFSRFVVVVKDPFISLIDQYAAKYCNPVTASGADWVDGAAASQRQDSQGNSSHRQPANCRMPLEKAILQQATYFNRRDLAPSKAQQFILGSLKPSEVMLMSHEFLMLPSTRVEAARKLLSFLKMPAADSERLMCSTVLVTGPEIESAVASFNLLRRYPALVCAVKRLLAKQIAAQYFNSILFHDMPCK